MTLSFGVKQGAEAHLWIGEWEGRPAVIKQRKPKTYRHPILEERLTSRRTKQEGRCMIRAAEKAGIRVPRLYHVDQSQHTITMEWIEDAVTLKTAFLESSLEEDWKALASQLGSLVARLHKVDLIHGDLTTSNVLLQTRTLVIIDFGLSYVSASVEDKAVDLYLLERALTSTHSTIASDAFALILEAYKQQEGAKGSAVLQRLAKVQLRGRKRSMIG